MADLETVAGQRHLEHLGKLGIVLYDQSLPMVPTKGMAQSGKEHVVFDRLLDPGRCTLDRHLPGGKYAEHDDGDVGHLL
jgi:hypothetical protein